MGGGRVLSQDNYQPKYLREDNKSFKELTEKTTDNGWIEFKKGAKVSHNSFFKNYASSLGLDKDYDFKPLKDETDNLKKRHQRFQLYYKNTLVEGVEFTLHSQDDVLTLGHGKIPEGLDHDISKPMPEPKALDLALADMKVTLADLKKLDRKKPNGTLLLTKISDEVVKANFRLCYVFDVYGNETLNAFKVYIDATTGEIVKKVSLIRSCFANHKKQSIEPIPNTLPAITNAPLTVLVPSTFTPNNNRYLNAQGGLGFETETDLSNTSRNRLSAFNNALNTRMATVSRFWVLNPDVFNVAGTINNNNPTDWTMNVASRNAQTAHWLVQRMHQFMSLAPIGRNGLNGNGSFPTVVTDVSAEDAAEIAATNTEATQIYFGQMGYSPNRSWVTADIVGHEYMHAVTDNTANLYYQGESGALNESLSDIFGTALERHLLPSGNDMWNWQVGEDTGEMIRSMENPGLATRIQKNTGSPQIYKDNSLWKDTSKNADNGGVHYNSGVMNKWFHTISTGQRIGGSTMLAVGFDRALLIVYNALAYLQSSSNYADMRNATVQAAKDLNNGDACAYEPFAVAKAWDDANVNGFTCTNTCDFNLTASTFNSNPTCGSSFTLNANCTGNNCTGVSYNWVGFGGVKTGQQVSYNAPTSNGSYTYNLTASRSGCSNKTASVTINVSNCAGNCSAGNFAGFFDAADCNTFSGWALDQNNFGRTLQIDIFVDGVNVGSVQANNSRPDLGTYFGNAAATPHGWSYSIPATASWRNGQNHSITARICGSILDLSNSPKTVTCSGGGGCTPPSAPSISANPSSISAGGSATLTASGCSGTVSWSGGQSGNAISVNPTTTTNYTATCTVGGCASGNSNTANVSVGSAGGSCASGNFGSSFDDANCNVFNGWALDHSNYGRTVDVEIRVDGQLVATVPANQSRSDLAAAFGTSAAELHGWWYYPPANAWWRNGQNRTVTTRICGASSDMSSSQKTVNCTGGTGTPPNPTPTPTPTPASCASGNFGGHFDTGNCAILNGWALDHNNYGRTVQVEIRVDGVLVKTIDANDSRSDLVGAFGTAAAEFHGWHYNPLPSDTWRNGTKTITTRICGATSDLNNSPKTVNFSNCRVGNADQEKVVVPSRDDDLSSSDLTLSPNPTNGELRFRIGLLSKTDVSVSLSDLAGRVLQSKIYKNREGQLDERLDLGDLVSGSYIFVLQTTEKRFSRKVVVVR
jgi:Zn-dependent metalloprotease